MRFIALLLCICCPSAARRCAADVFVYRDDAGEQQTLDARLLGSGRGFHALLKADGQIELVRQEAVERREPADGPQPLSEAAMVEVLQERFGAELLRAHVERPFVVGFVAAGPLDRRAETRVKGFVQKSARFLNNVRSVFDRFARDMRFPLRDPEYPLVMLVFESEHDFNAFAVESSGGEGLSARNIAGFYSGLTNWLAIRLEECRTFQVPLHEAIHQQMYNRVFQRLAPIPKWFDEGIATGFENNGERVDIHPARINGLYASLARRLPADEVSWADIVTDDRSFVGDVLAAESYIEAWSLHWMLVTERTAAYRRYVQELATRQTLEELPVAARTEHFEQVFGTTVAELAEDFPRVLEAGLKRQKLRLPPAPPAGVMLAHAALAEVRVRATNDLSSGRLLVEGQIRNTSPIRPLTYHVAVVTESGLYTDWIIERLGVNESAPLTGKVAAKVLPGSLGGQATTFTVRVQSVLPDSSAAREWLRAAPLPAGFPEP